LIMADDRMTIRVPADMLARIDDLRGEESRSAWVLAAVGRELTDGPAIVPVDSPEVTHEIPAGGIPSPGVVCQWGGMLGARYSPLRGHGPGRAHPFGLPGACPG
jgi:hypothetical protein